MHSITRQKLRNLQQSKHIEKSTDTPHIDVICLATPLHTCGKLRINYREINRSVTSNLLLRLKVLLLKT